ncbi:FkbM family methyltransferase [Mesorhizobium sp. M0933]|uniref:FkbM family methyltransferase n=1 Tax=Mesorhizobium sp. M0933 TaxID=2957030 RepID=UPI003339ACC1
MKRLLDNRYFELIRVVISSNPIELGKFILQTITGGQFACRLNVRGCSLLIRPNSPDLQVIRTILLGEFDEAMRRVRPKFGFVIDAGGYIGMSAIAFARRFPTSRIVVLEPDLENYHLASENCRALENVDVLNCALGSVEGSVSLYDRGTGAWGFTTVQDATDASELKRIGEVPSVTVSTLLRRYGVEGVDLLKLDIEGAEHDVLSGRPEWIAKCGVIIAELHDRIRPGCTDVFRDATAGREQFSAGGEKLISVWTASPV